MLCAFAPILAASMALSPLAASAEDKPLEWLLVQTASEFTTDGSTLTLPYEREILAFTDRPNRRHLYINAHKLASLWNRGANDFTQNPPNAVLTWGGDDGVREAEVELTSAFVKGLGPTITCEIAFEAGDTLPATGRMASVFIDSWTPIILP